MRFMVSRRALPLRLLALGSVLAPGFALAQGAGTPVVMIFGDSLSAAYGLPQGSGWVDLLGKRLAAEPRGWRVVNASISGETTQGGRNRIDAELARHQPRVVVIALGGNDGLRGVSLDVTRGNLEYMVSAARRVHARPLLVGVRLPPNYGRTYAEKFRLIFHEVAKRTHTPLVPFLLEAIAERRDLFQADGIHPVKAAQPLILDTVWPALRPLLDAK
jgi:acyl-CoA thioesterase-1